MSEIGQSVAVAKRSVANIREYLGGLTPEQWELPSACAEWQVRDVVSHLIGGAERQAQSMERGRGGDSNPPAGFVPSDRAALSTANAQRDIDRRSQLAGKVLEAFDAGYEKLHREYDGFGEVSWDTLCWHVRRGAMTAASYVELRIKELAVHDWDIRSAFQPGAGLDSDSVPVLLDMSPTWLGMCFRPSVRLPKPVVYGFSVGPEEARQYRMSVTGESFEMVTASVDDPSQADLSLAATAEQYLLFTYGRLTAVEGISSGKLKVQGDTAHLDRFEVWFKGL